MDYNQQLETFLGIGLDEYPGSDFSPIEEFYVSFSRHPRFISTKQLAAPLCGLFDRVEVVTFPNLLNRVMSLTAVDFEPAQMILLENLVNGLVAIYGGDNKGMLWLLEEEMEEIESGEWNGRHWEFPKYDELHDVALYLSKERGLRLMIKETDALLDF